MKKPDTKTKAKDSTAKRSSKPNLNTIPGMPLDGFLSMLEAGQKVIENRKKQS